MKTATTIILILAVAFIWQTIRVNEVEDYSTKQLLQNDSVIDELERRAVMYDSAEAKTERTYNHMRQAIDSTNINIHHQKPIR